MIEYKDIKSMVRQHHERLDYLREDVIYLFEAVLKLKEEALKIEEVLENGNKKESIKDS